MSTPLDPPPEWGWVPLDEIEAPLRARVAGTQPIEPGRFLAYRPHPLTDARLYTGFVGFSASSFALFTLVLAMIDGALPGPGPGVALLVGVVAGVATYRLPGSRPRPRQGLSLLPDHLVAFDGGGRALVIPRAQLHGAVATSGSVLLLRHDRARFHLDAGYASRFRPSFSHFNRAFERWVATGEPVFTGQTPAPGG